MSTPSSHKTRFRRVRGNKNWCIGTFLSAIGCLLPLASGPSEKLGEHVTVGYDNARTSVNSGISSLLPPLRLDRSISLAGVVDPGGLSVLDGLLLVRDNGDGNFHLFEQLSGAQRWSTELEPQTAGTGPVPAVANGIVLLGNATTAAAVDLQTGQVLWTDPDADLRGHRSPVLTGSLALYHGASKVVAAQAQSGEHIWETDLETGAAPISLFGDRVYVLDAQGRIRCLDLFSGQQLWASSAQFEARGQIIATEETVFSPVRFEGDQGQEVLGAAAFDSSSGQLRWTAPVPARGRPISCVLKGGRLISFGEVPFGEEPEIHSLDASSGEEVWSATETGFSDRPIPFDLPQLYDPVGVGEVLYYFNLAGPQDQSDQLFQLSFPRIQARSSASGTLLWTIRLDSQIRALSVAGSQLFALMNLERRVDVYSPSFELFFPHLADGQGQSTAFVLTNPSGQPVNGRIDFISDSGDALQIPLQGGAGPVSSQEFDLDPRSSIRIQSSGDRTTLQSGWARLTADGPLTANSLFRLEVGDAITHEAGIAVSRPSSEAAVSVEVDGEVSTALAISNPMPFEIEIRLQLKGDDNETPVILRFPPEGHRARFVEELFSLPPEGFDGTLFLDCEFPFAATALRTSGGRQLSSLPVGLAVP